MPFPTSASNALEQYQIDVSCHAENDAEEFYEEINDIIQRAEFHIWTDSQGILGFRHEDIVELTPSQEAQDIHPEGDYVVVTAVKVMDDTGEEFHLLYKDESFIQELNQEADDDMPRFYCATGQETGGSNKILLAPMPDDNYQGIVEYIAFDSLIDSPTGTWLTREAGDVLFYAILIDAYTFLKADPKYIAELDIEYRDALEHLLFRQQRLMRNTAFKYSKSVVK